MAGADDAKVGKEVAIMADLQGPKIRVGRFEGDRTTLTVGQKFILDGDNTKAQDIYKTLKTQEDKGHEKYTE